MNARKKTSARELIAAIAILAIAISLIPQMNTQAAKKQAFDKVKAWQVISADVSLNGSGTGYHAKIRFNNFDGAISLGIQYDNEAVAPYTGKAVIIVENVFGYGPGKQEYTRPGDIFVEPGQKVNLMLTLSKKGNIGAYCNGKLIGRYHNDTLVYGGKNISSGVEGAARLNGDGVDADFTNIRARYQKYTGREYFDVSYFENGEGIKIKADGKKGGSDEGTNGLPKHVRIKGKLSLASNRDWDSLANSVQGVCAFLFNTHGAEVNGVSF